MTATEFELLGKLEQELEEEAAPKTRTRKMPKR
jgi:hypothetical protein